MNNNNKAKGTQKGKKKHEKEEKCKMFTALTLIGTAKNSPSIKSSKASPSAGVSRTSSPTYPEFLCKNGFHNTPRPPSQLLCHSRLVYTTGTFVCVSLRFYPSSTLGPNFTPSGKWLKSKMSIASERSLPLQQNLHMTPRPSTLCSQSRRGYQNFATRYLPLCWFSHSHSESSRQLASVRERRRLNQR